MLSSDEYKHSLTIPKSHTHTLSTARLRVYYTLSCEKLSIGIAATKQTLIKPTVGSCLWDIVEFLRVQGSQSCVSVWQHTLVG